MHIRILILVSSVCLLFSSLGMTGESNEQDVVPESDSLHLFLKTDLNSDGFISLAESLSELPLNNTFTHFDINQDELISHKEFLPYYNLRYGLSFNAKSFDSNDNMFKSEEEAFYWLDKNRDGVISIDEFKDIDIQRCRHELFMKK